MNAIQSREIEVKSSKICLLKISESVKNVIVAAINFVQVLDNK